MNFQNGSEYFKDSIDTACFIGYELCENVSNSSKIIYLIWRGTWQHCRKEKEKYIFLSLIATVFHHVNTGFTTSRGVIYV